MPRPHPRAPQEQEAHRCPIHPLGLDAVRLERVSLGTKENWI